jgi:hypothetical protein
MKHIKLFNEKIETDIELELVKFCDENLAYLIDDGFYIFINNSSGSDSNASNIPIKSFDIIFNNTEGASLSTNIFSWNIIKDDFIPFVQFLKSKYNVRDTVLLTYEDDYGSYTYTPNSEKSIDIYDLIKDNIEDYIENVLVEISIRVYY